jgi:hypothetical protein
MLAEKKNLISCRIGNFPDITSGWLNLLLGSRSLKKLTISIPDQMMTDIHAVKALAFNKTLEELTVNVQALNDDVVRIIASMRNIQKLSLCVSSSQGRVIVTEKGMQALAMNKSVQQLTLNGFHLNDDGLIPIANMQNIQELKLYLDADFSQSGGEVATITDNTFKALAANPSLRKLVLDVQSPTLTDEGIKALADNHTLLELSFNTRNFQNHKGYNSYITDVGMQYLSTNQTLRKLELSRCMYLTDAGVKAIAKNTTLRELSLISIDNLTDKSIEILATNQTLKTLTLHVSSRDITRISVNALAGNHTLEELRLENVSDCDEEVVALAANKTLQKLHLSICYPFDVEKVYGALLDNTTLNELTLDYMGRNDNIADPHKRAIKALQGTEKEICFPSLEKLCLFAVKKLPVDVKQHLSQDLRDKLPLHHPG